MYAFSVTYVLYLVVEGTASLVVEPCDALLEGPLVRKYNHKGQMIHY